MKGGKRVVVMWVEDEGVEVGLLCCFVFLIMREVNKTVWRGGFVIFTRARSKMWWSECLVHELQ